MGAQQTRKFIMIKAANGKDTKIQKFSHHVATDAMA